MCKNRALAQSQEEGSGTNVSSSSKPKPAAEPETTGQGNPPPQLETARLLLRGHRREDFADTRAMWSDPTVTRYIGGRPFTNEECWARLLRYGGLWPILGYGYWVVTEKASGRFVGEVGFADFKREMTPSFAGVPEAGWALAPWAHGRGFATEAIVAATEWLDRRLGKPRTVCMIHPDHAASIRVAEKAGYRRWASSEFKGEPAILFER
jgi:RimJ/RimL family protein N-acetyltransferase